MRGLELNTVGYIIIGIASAGMLLILFSGLFGEAATSMFCAAYGMFLPAADKPAYCSSDYCSSIQPKTIAERDKDGQAVQLAAHVVRCFVDKNEICRQLDNVSVCYVLKLEKPAGVKERDVTDVIANENKCLDIMNSFVNDAGSMAAYSGCGNRDDIDWQAGINQQLIIVGYDSAKKQVVVR